MIIMRSVLMTCSQEPICKEGYQCHQAILKLTVVYRWKVGTLTTYVKRRYADTTNEVQGRALDQLVRMTGLATMVLHLMYVLENIGYINIDGLPFLGWMAYGTLSCLAKRAHKLDFVDHPTDRVYACEAGFVAVNHGDGNGQYISIVRLHPRATVIWYKDLWIAKRAQASRKYYIPSP